ncbi:MAG: hypothetical protein ABL930_12280, partial [Pseudobdellovibrio sp.]
AIVKKLSYENYFKNILKFGFYNLATPGLSSLSWHVRTILYCKEKGINTVYDGMTAELLHLPGHMPEIRELFKSLYKKYDIEFSSLVIDWEVPPDQRFVDKLILDRHGFHGTNAKPLRTTGQWLYENDLLPHPNIKGSEFDRLMQHDCYPFVIYNMIVFWLFEPLIGFAKYKLSLKKFIQAKIDFIDLILNEKVSGKSPDLFLNNGESN